MESSSATRVRIPARSHPRLAARAVGATLIPASSAAMSVSAQTNSVAGMMMCGFSLSMSA